MLSGIGSSRGETRSTQTAHTLAMALAIILCSGETIKILLQHQQFQMVKGTESPMGTESKQGIDTEKVQELGLPMYVHQSII